MNIEVLLQEIKERLCQYQIPLINEKDVQVSLFDIILKDLGFEREFRLGSGSVIDFFNVDLGVGIEVKIKGKALPIYRQCARYARFPSIKYIVLITSKEMGLPNEIEGKPSYYISLNNSWL